MKYLIPLALFVLAGCKTTNAPPPEPIIQTVEVKVPVSTPCVPAELGGPPAYVDTDDALRAAVDAAIRYQLLWAGRAQRIARERELQVVVDGCPRESE